MDYRKKAEEIHRNAQAGGYGTERIDPDNPLREDLQGMQGEQFFWDKYGYYLTKPVDNLYGGDRGVDFYMTIVERNKLKTVSVNVRTAKAKPHFIPLKQKDMEVHNTDIYIIGHITPDVGCKWLGWEWGDYLKACYHAGELKENSWLIPDQMVWEFPIKRMRSMSTLERMMKDANSQG